MKILALDISGRSGWAALHKSEDGSISFDAETETGIIEREKTCVEYGPYPKSYRLAAAHIADQLLDLIDDHEPDVVVIEETNQGKNRYTQKYLEWIHLLVQQGWEGRRSGGFFPQLDHRCAYTPEPSYISTGIWKQALGIKKPESAKQNDELLKKAKLAFKTKLFPTLNAAKAHYGIRGKWNKKMAAVDYVNQRYGLKWKLKDNDRAEAVCLGIAYSVGAQLCDGNPSGKKSK